MAAAQIPSGSVDIRLGAGVQTAAGAELPLALALPADAPMTTVMAHVATLPASSAVQLSPFGFAFTAQLNAAELDESQSVQRRASLTRQAVYNASTLRLETLKAGAAAPFETLQKLSYTYDLVGNVQTLTDAQNSNQVQSFGYDWLDRLTSATTNGMGVGQYSHTYQYNAIGNITSYNGNAYTYGSQPHAVTAAFGNSYAYDANGNQSSRTIGGVTYTFTYDYENRLTAIAGGSVTASFLYDAEGNRVKGTVNGVTTVYVAGLYEW